MWKHIFIIENNDKRDFNKTIKKQRNESSGELKNTC